MTEKLHTFSDGGDLYDSRKWVASSRARVEICLPSARKPAVAWTKLQKKVKNTGNRTTCQPNVSIYRLNPPIRSWDKEFRVNEILHRQDNSIFHF